MGRNTLLSAAEVRATPGFMENLPVSIAVFVDFVNDYSVGDEDLRCCVLKENGNLCGEEHRNGYLVVLSCGGVSLVGINCAKQKFSADERFNSARARFDNQQKRDQKLGQLAEMLERKTDFIAQVNKIRGELAVPLSFVQSLHDAIGPIASRGINRLSSSTSPAIEAVGITNRPGVDEETGKPIIERTPTPFVVARLQVGPFLASGAIAAVRYALLEVERAFLLAEALGENPRGSKIDELIATISRLPAHQAAANAAADQVHRFSTQDLRALCFLVEQADDRARIIRFILELQGQPLGKHAAKAWLEQYLREVCTANGFNSVKSSDSRALRSESVNRKHQR